MQSCAQKEEKGGIDRRSVVSRHNVHVTEVDTLSSLTVGNGSFAFTVDITGLQTFPEYYDRGVSLGTQSEWGWHSFPNTENYDVSESLREYELEGKKITYMVQQKNDPRSEGASNYFRINQHRLQLGNIGFEIYKTNGELIKPGDVKEIDQTLDLWTGQILSRFSIEGVPVEVVTYGSMDSDAISAKVKSALIAQGRLKAYIRYPYPSGNWSDYGTYYEEDDQHSTEVVSSSSTGAVIDHSIDTTTYFTQMSWSDGSKIENTASHYFVIEPAGGDEFEFNVAFSQTAPSGIAEGFSGIEKSSVEGWKGFWESGGVVDFSGSTDARAGELERRVVLSQYLTRAQCAGNFPPQETGLTYNSWYGKPHLEMHWWHAVHFALWGRPELMERSLDWYFKALPTAQEIAERQGFEGVRWQKMTDNDGREVPSSVGTFLIWQQPHLIYMAELLYRQNPSEAVLDKWKDLVFKTADFMASFPTYDSVNDRYNLGKGLIPAQECFNAVETFNPNYELAYWNWALGIAQKWKERSGMERDLEWDKILDKLSPPPVKDGVYLAAESTPNCYSEDSPYKIDHPAVLGALSTLPAGDYIDKETMLKTYNLVEEVWTWNHTWGWDFPLIAMTAARLDRPDLALNGLFKDIVTNTYLPNGHNYQSPRLTIYLPGNGGILSAVAMMCAGFDEADVESPGFPKDGSWNVKWEGLQPMP